LFIKIYNRSLRLLLGFLKKSEIFFYSLSSKELSAFLPFLQSGFLPSKRGDIPYI